MRQTGFIRWVSCACVLAGVLAGRADHWPGWRGPTGMGPGSRHDVCTNPAMRVQCPACLGFHVRPAPLRWYEVPLALVLIQPYLCRSCKRRFLAFRQPDLPLPSLTRRRLSTR